MRAPRWTWLLALAALLLYLLTLSRHYTADGLLFALDIDSGQPSNWLDPYHLLLHPLALLFLRLWRGLGYRGFSIVPLQVLNALGGAVCVALFASIVHRLTRSGWITALCSAGLAVSGGMWLLSVEAEFVTIPLASQLLVLWLLLNAPRDLAKRPLYGWMLGLAIAFATLCYLTGLFLWPIALIALRAREDLPPATRRHLSVTLSVVMLIGLGAALLLSAPLWSGPRGRDFVTALLGGGYYGRLTWSSLPHGIYAFLRSLLLYPGLAMNDSTRSLLTAMSWPGRLGFALLYLCVLLIAVLPVWIAWRRRGTVWSDNRFLRLVLIAWTLPFAAFAVIWVPGDFSFLMPVLVAWWLLMAVTLPSVQRGARWLVALLILLLCFNGGLSLLPRANARTNARLTLALDLARLTADEDLLFLADQDGMTLLHLWYFARRTAWVVPLPLEPEPDPALDFIAKRAASALSAGHSVWAVGFDSSTRPALDRLRSSVAARLGSPCPTPATPTTIAGHNVWPLCAAE